MRPRKTIRRNAFTLFLVCVFLIIVHLLILREVTNDPEQNLTLKSRVFSKDDLMKIVDDVNREQLIINEHFFRPLLDQDHVIVIQVHNRAEYLRHVIESHSKAERIENSLMIFSHDYYDEEINQMILNIKFCKVMQIFYPYSIQIYPDEFPGMDPMDCPPNINRKKAEEVECGTVNNTDNFGHYRTPSLSQIKHHWWWKINFIFGKIRILENFNGLVTFLEEDHYVLEDYIYFIDLMKSYCRENLCDVITLGKDKLSGNYRGEEPIILSKTFSNFGLTFNRSTWANIQRCANLFCTFDDYNWDWSIVAVSKKCLDRPLHFLIPINSRVMHIGNCGVHTKKQCDVKALVTKIEKRKYVLYPEALQIRKKSNDLITRQYGGWGDKRDHQLCLRNTFYT